MSDNKNSQKPVKINPKDTEENDFRTSVGTMDNQGTRKWVFPKKPKGKYTSYRSYVVILLLVIFFSLPFLTIDGNPVLLINILDSEFYIFGQPFYPQDFFILALGAIASMVFIILFTVAFGRIFCGWICPQTIFMEGVFRKIEYWIEGDRNKQMKLDKQPWNAEKIRKRGLKWSIYIIISLIVTHFMFMYIVGYKNVFQIMEEGPIEHFTKFIVMILFTASFYLVFAWFREQVCTLVCPYGRFQGVLIDKQTINVYYDYKRGEGRSKWKKNEDRAALGKGDCIDCGQCVVVCPTGIDIRNGQQLECINCTACIDACNEVMEKVGFPKGLIRYATEDEIDKGDKFKFTMRMKAYTLVLAALVVFLGFLLYNRGAMEAKFIKPAGSTYFIVGSQITNTYNYTLLNKSNKDQEVIFKVLEPKHGVIVYGGTSDIKMKRDKIVKGTINISFPINEITSTKQKLTIGVYDKKTNKMLTSFDTYFEGQLQLQF